MKFSVRYIFQSPAKFLVVSIIFLIIAIWFFNFQISVRTQKQNNLALLNKNLQNELQKIESDYQDLEPKLQNVKGLYTSDLPSKYAFIILQNERLVYWSDFHFLPSNRELRGDYYIKLINRRSSFYLLVKYEHEPALEIFYILPLIERYPIVNEYLKDKVNLALFLSNNFEILPVKKDTYNEISIDNKALFYIMFSHNYSNIKTNTHAIVLLLFSCSIIFLGMYVSARVKLRLNQKRYNKVFFNLFFWIAFARGIMIYFDFPFVVYQNELFNARNYASSVVNPSLGDLFFNALLIVILITFVFKHYYHLSFFQWCIKGSKAKKTVISIVFIFANFALLSLFYLLFNSLNFHSQWSLDISRELNFHYLKVISYLIVVIAGLTYFLLSQIIFKVVVKIHRSHLPGLLLSYFLGTSLFIVVAIVDRWEYELISVIGTLYFVILYIFNLPDYLRRIQYISFVYFFVGSIPLCIVGSYSIYKYQNRKLVDEKNRLAGQLLVENDVLTEFLLTEAGKQIAEDVFIQNRIFNPYVSKINIEQRVQRVYLNNQLEKYDIDVYLFNSRGQPIDESSDNLNDIKSRYQDFALDSSLFFINKYEENTIRRYLKFIEVKRYSRVAGYVLIDLKLRRVIPNSVYPILLIDNRYSGPDISSEYSYAIYENNRLIFNTGDYNYQERIDSRMLHLGETRDGYKTENYTHFVVKGENNRVIIISFTSYPIQNTFSNFSFLFILFLGHILLALIIINLYLRIIGIKQNYAARIQLYLNAAFLIPLIIICVSAISVIVKSYDENLELENRERANNISARVSESLDAYLTRDVSKEQLSEVVNEISQFTEIDVNIFGNNGRLLASSQPLIYENELLAELINPKAYAGIYIENKGSLVLEEQIGELSYKNTYTPIKSFKSGQQIGILSLPFFHVRQELEENVISVLTNVMNIFTIIFLVFMILSYLVSTWLTFPLQLITQKIKKTSLLDRNEPLEWNSDDEIGLMVGEYNKMLVNLEQSKLALAQSEKESAWREIARQVAHEIKNPLTPMQLTLQHMRRTLSEDHINKEKRIQQIDALLHQINTLSDIATSFSAFAKMPVPKNEIFELNNLVSETVALYNKEELAEIEVDLPLKKFVVNADKKWIGQAITNIIINGIHAAEQKGNVLIDVTLKAKTGNKCQLSIKDNGLGIPEDIRSKIFIPNFSTKEKGSGIGLAIAKRAVEHAGGTIWFETEINVGSTFYIELPLHS